jgi:hypothetical protein
MKSDVSSARERSHKIFAPYRRMDPSEAPFWSAINFRKP